MRPLIRRLRSHCRGYRLGMSCSGLVVRKQLVVLNWSQSWRVACTRSFRSSATPFCVVPDSMLGLTHSGWPFTDPAFCCRGFQHAEQSPVRLLFCSVCDFSPCHNPLRFLPKAAYICLSKALVLKEITNIFSQFSANTRAYMWQEIFLYYSVLHCAPKMFTHFKLF